MPFSLFGKLSLDGTGFKRGLDRAKGSVVGFGAKIKKSLGGLGGMMAGMFAAGMIKSQITDTIEWGTKIRDLGVKFGVTTKFLQEMEYAFTQTGLSIEDGMKAFKKMQIFQHRTLSQFRGSNRRNELAASFELLGASIQDVEKMKPQELFLHIARNLKNADTSSAGLQEALNTVFGGTGVDLLNTFANDVDGLRANFQALGATVEDDVIKKLGAAGDKMEEIKTRLTAGTANVGGWLFDRWDDISDMRRGMSDQFADDLTDIMAGKSLGDKLKGTGSMILRGATLGLSGVGDLAERQAALKREREAEQARKRQAKAEAAEKAAAIQDALVEKNKAKTVEAENAAKKKAEDAEKRRRAVWAGHGPDRLEKIGGRMGMATTQLNISQRQLNEMIKAQRIRELNHGELMALRRTLED